MAAATISPALNRIFLALPLPPVVVGIGSAMLGFAFYFAVEFSTGQVAAMMDGTAEDHIQLHWRVAGFTIPLLAYLVTAQVYHYRWTLQNLQEIGGLLPADPAPSPTPPRVLPGLLGALFFTTIILILPADIPDLLTSEHWVFEHTWDWLIVPALGWNTGQLGFLMIKDSLALSRMADRIVDIDLLDLSPLASFLRQGQQSAMLVLIYIGLSFPHITVPNSTLSFLSIASGAVLVAGASLLLPLRGIHQRVVSEKRSKLAEIRHAIRQAESVALSDDESGHSADGVALRLPARLALEARIHAVPEWLVDGSSMARSALYLAIGFGSWLGAAMVERLLDVALQ